MNKQFDLVIDTKRTNYNSIRGLKQGDNNSVLNITLVQDSVPFDLTGLTVRINYKRTDNKVFLQMADIINATEGQIKVNVLTKVLEKSGTSEADLSIFDKNNRKITSITFSMFVEASVYTNDYLEPEDLDIIQNVWTSENTRIESEDVRIENEKDRVVNEGNRKTNENIRVKNEENRQQDYSKMNSRIDNLVLGTGSPAEVIDAHLDGATGEKYPTLKERLDNTSEKLKENATKETTLKDGIEHLDGGVDGILNINSIGGNTLYKRADGTYTDEWEENVILESVKDNIEIISKNLDKTKEDKTTIQLKEPLRGLLNGIKDELLADSTVIRRIGKIILNGSEEWRKSTASQMTGDTISFPLATLDKVIKWNNQYHICDKFNSYTTWNTELESCGFETAPSEKLRIRILKSKLEQYGYIESKVETYVPSFKEWLSENPTTVLYELEEPIIEKIETIKPLKCWGSGSLITNSNITPMVNFKYPTNLNSRLSSVEENTLNNSNFVKEQNAVNLEFDFRITALENKEGVYNV